MSTKTITENVVNSGYVYIPCAFGQDGRQYYSTGFPATSSIEKAKEYQQEFIGILRAFGIPLVE